MLVLTRNVAAMDMFNLDTHLMAANNDERQKCLVTHDVIDFMGNICRFEETGQKCSTIWWLEEGNGGKRGVQSTMGY